MIRHPSGYFEIRENRYSRLTIDLSHGNIDFSYSDADGGHAHFDVDADDLRKVIDILAPANIESDPRVAAMVADERARCAEICAEVRRTALRQTTGDMAHANGIAVGAEYCERMIRGEK